MSLGVTETVRGADDTTSVGHSQSSFFQQVGFVKIRVETFSFTLKKHASLIFPNVIHVNGSVRTVKKSNAQKKIEKNNIHVIDSYSNVPIDEESPSNTVR